MKLLIAILLFILLTICSCEDDSVFCWKCKVSYETTMWDANRLRLGVPINTDTLLYICGVSQIEIANIEDIHIDSFIVNDDNLYCKVITKTKCERQ